MVVSLARPGFANLQDSFAFAQTFSKSSLGMLIRGQVDVIWHQQFYPPVICQAVLPGITEACETANYTLTGDLQSLGTSIGEATESAENTERYLLTAQDTISMIRDELFRDYKSPCDVIRLLADEYWPYGAMVGKHGESAMLSGIIRRWPSGGHANPHIDQRDIPLLSNYNLVRRIGINVYLETPEDGCGGEIEFWHKITDEALYVSQKRSDYGLDRDQLGDPMCVIHPHQGDLIMFDAARIHGVRRVTDGSRVTAACFLGAKSTRDPLVVFA
jgi:2OG-Fe(II) oxygenase superfamily